VPTVEPAPKPAGLRERKKAKTRRALIEVSQRLFATKGYANTTLEEICEQVEIRPQTLLRYFESKAHLAIAPMADVIEDLRTKIVDPGRNVDTIDLWREHVEARAIFHSGATARIIRRYYKWTAQDPVLVAMSADLNRRTQEYLAEGIATDHGVEADDLHSTLLTALLVAGWNAVFLRWLEDGADPAELGPRQHAVVDFAIENLPRRTARQLHITPALDPLDQERTP
jgi:AcrR family transcriptional regulator